MVYCRVNVFTPCSFAKILLAILLAVVCSFSREVLRPLHSPYNFAEIGILAELRDDVYSGDLNFSAEFAPCNCLALYGDVSYRLISYEFDTMLHDQIHEMVNLQVNGFNESYVGMKLMPYPYVGLDVSWRFPPGEGSRVNRFNRLGIAPFGIYNFSRGMQLGVAAGYYTFLEDQNFQPGDEFELRGSIDWRLAWDYSAYKGWLVDYVFLYRWRLQESRNLNMDRPYQKMNDDYRGFRMRVDMGRYFSVVHRSLGIVLFYEMNRGNLFGFETGHTLGLYTKFVF